MIIRTEKIEGKYYYYIYNIYDTGHPRKELARLLLKDNVYLFRIVADYRPKSDDNPIYYAAAPNKTEAESRFKSKTVLTIYECQKMEDEQEIENVLCHPINYIVI